MNDNSTNNNNQVSHNSSPVNESGFDLKVIIGKFLAFLPYFIISLIISLLIAFLVNRYSTPKFMIRASLLIKEKGASKGGLDGAENFLQGMQLLSTSRNIENEQGIIKSRFMVEETLKQRNFGISYFSKGSIKKNDLYGSQPFFIEIDSNHLQVCKTEVVLDFLSDKEVEVSIEDPGYCFVPKTGELTNSTGLFKKKKYPINQNITSELFSFKLQVLDPRILHNTGVNYSVKLNLFGDLVKEYNGRYNVKTINKLSSILEISKEGEWPEKDKAFIDQLCMSYIQLGLDDKNKVTQNTIRFIDIQLANVSDSLGAVESQLQDFKSYNKIVDLGATGVTIIENIGNLEKLKAEEELRNKYYNYLDTYLRQSNVLDDLIAPSSMGINEPLLNSVLQKLVELYTKKKTLELSFRAENPLLIETNQNLNNLKLTLLENINSIKTASKIVMQDLNQRIGKFETEISGLPRNEQKLINMTRKYQLSDKLYTYLLEKRAEAGIAGAGINPDSKVIDKAVITEKTYPKNSNNYLIAGTIGIILPLLIILTLEFFNNSIHNHSQLQQITKIPLIGNIVHSTKDTALVIANHPKSQVSEAFRNLRSNLNYLASDSKKKVIMVTSTVSGEGKTFIGMNLSSVLAIGGYKTLLIGVDLRKPKIFQDFKLDNSFGLTNYLIGKLDRSQIIQKTEVPNLDVITAGPTPPNPSELIMSAAFKQLIEDYKKEYDYIILDTPPIGLVADGLDIMKFSDIILYVARQNVSKRNYLNLINELYVNEKNKNIGLIFNDVNFAAVYGYGYGAYGYGYGYGYKSGYGSGYGYGYGYGSGYGYGDTEIETKSWWQRFMGR
ncbi:MAG: polysaccharide biosynthesis tyrosine autokinase [Bacteroidia bacterium]|nr:polysaccharide biosynthesis tyrosine autokinase [Bacteroidia bacterium]